MLDNVKQEYVSDPNEEKFVDVPCYVIMTPTKHNKELLKRESRKMQKGYKQMSNERSFHQCTKC